MCDIFQGILRVCLPAHGHFLGVSYSRGEPLHSTRVHGPALAGMCHTPPRLITVVSKVRGTLSLLSSLQQRLTVIRDLSSFRPLEEVVRPEFGSFFQQNPVSSMLYISFDKYPDCRA
jgi:hypothetical protein